MPLDFGILPENFAIFITVKFLYRNFSFGDHLLVILYKIFDSVSLTPVFVLWFMNCVTELPDISSSNSVFSAVNKNYFDRIAGVWLGGGFHSI